jgi:hypothetical protein
VSDISSGEIIQSKAIVFQGERGNGKTWLSLHLHREILPKIANVTSLLISMSAPPEGYSAQNNEWFSKPPSHLEKTSPDDTVKKIVEWVALRLGTTTAPDATLRELTGWLVRDIEQLLKQRILVLILDSIFEADWSLLEKLEQHLLAPLAALPRTLIVMTGRGRLYPWESPYLRVGAQTSALNQFDFKEIREQLKRQVPETEAWSDERLREEIENPGGGHPLSNYLLAREGISGLGNVIQILLGVIPEEKRKRVGPYIEALCVLDGFRENEMPPMLAAHANNAQLERMPTSQVHEVRDELMGTHLVRWENGRFILDRAIRIALASNLRIHQPDKWRQLHCRAYRLYSDWAQGFGDRYREYFTQRASRHAIELKNSDFNPEDCPKPETVPVEMSSSEVVRA